MYLWLEEAKSRTTFGNVCNVMSIKRLILNPEYEDERVAEDGCRMPGERIVRKREKKTSFLFPCQYKLHYLICGSLSSTPAMPSSLRGDQTSAVTCQSSPDRQWPCSALLETIWIDLAFASCFRCWFPWQLACKRGAMPNKIGLIGSQISWFTGFESEGPEMFIAFLYSVVLQILCAQWGYCSEWAFHIMALIYQANVCISVLLHWRWTHFLHISNNILQNHTANIHITHSQKNAV